MRLRRLFILQHASIHAWLIALLSVRNRTYYFRPTGELSTSDFSIKIAGQNVTWTGLSYGTYGQNPDMVPIFESGAGEHHIHPSIYLNRLGVRTPGLGTSIRVSSAVCRREDSPERLSVELIQPDPRPPPRSVKLGVF